MTPEAARQCLLLCLIRALVQACRLAWTPLSVLIAAEAGMSLTEQATLLAAFPLGYMLTQVVGGVAADRVGGKSVQTLVIFAFAACMLGATLLPPSALRTLYLLAGVCAGPQQPAYSAMAAAWFTPAERGVVSAYGDLGTLGGEMAATTLAPMLADWWGWRAAFAVFTGACVAFGMSWAAFAQSRPLPQTGLAADARQPTGGHESLGGRGGGGGGGGDDGAEVKRSQEPGAVSFGDSARALACVPLWAVIVQHMSFNGSKYLLSSWLPTYYARHYSLSPALSSKYIAVAQLVGVGAQFAWARAERSLLHRRSLLFSRRAFALAGFVGMGVSSLALGWSHAAGATDPSATALPLCGFAFGVAAHSFGFKANYLDLSKKHSGLFMGVGNSLASAMTLFAPLGAAHLMQSSGDNWGMLFWAATAMSAVGAVVGALFTSVTSVDASDAWTASKSDEVSPDAPLEGAPEARAAARTTRRQVGRAALLVDDQLKLKGERSPHGARRV